MKDGFSIFSLLLVSSLLAAAQGCFAMNSGEESKGEVERVQVGDITMAYKVLGQGDPLVLIMGYSCTMDLWDPRLLDLLSSRYQVIIFDNRGMGYTTAPPGNFSMGQFANDTAGLLDNLGIEKAHVMGWSMGANIAQELAIRYPELVNRTILYAGDCGGTQAQMPSPEVLKELTNTSGSAEERGKRLLGLIIPEDWMSGQPEFYKSFPVPTEISSVDSIERQAQAFASWQGTYDRLDRIESPTLLVTGTEDLVEPPENSFIIAQRINSSWLVQFNGGGHGLMYQYPERLAKIITAFIELSD